MNLIAISTIVVKYWPAVVAALYLAYVSSAGQTAQIPAALAALMAALGIPSGPTSPVAAAHARLTGSITQNWPSGPDL